MLRELPRIRLCERPLSFDFPRELPTTNHHPPGLL